METTLKNYDSSGQASSDGLARITCSNMAPGTYIAPIVVSNRSVKRDPVLNCKRCRKYYNSESEMIAVRKFAIMKKTTILYPY